MTARSASLAASRASSPITVTYAPSSPLRSSIRSRNASTTSTGERSRRRILDASSAAGVKQSDPDTPLLPASRCRAIEYLGQVVDAGVVVRAPETAFEVHQAARVAGDKGCGPALLERPYLLIGHRDGHIGHLDRECPPEPAAQLLVPPAYELEPLDVLEQLDRLLELAQLPPLVAAGVKDRLPLEAGAEVPGPEHVHHEVRELPDAVPEGLGALPLLRQLLEDERVVVRDHRGTRARGTHDVVPALTFEDVEEVAGHAAGLVEETGVEGRLAAARLPLRVDDLDAEPPQHANDAHADLRVYHVNVARHEKGYPHRSTTFPSYPITRGQYSNRSAQRVRPHLREAWTRC